MNVLDTLLKDDADTLAQIIGEKVDSVLCCSRRSRAKKDIMMNQSDKPLNKHFLSIDTFSVPDILSDSPPIISIACYFKSTRCLNYLLNMNASITKADSRHRLPIHFAAAGGDIDLLRLLEQKYNNIDLLKGFFSIDRSVNGPKTNNNNDNNNFDLISAFLLTDDEQNNCVHYAAYYGNAEILRYFHIKGIPMMIFNIFNQTAFHLASEFGHYDCVSFLAESSLALDHLNCIENKALIESNELNSKKAIFKAAKYGHSKVFKYIFNFFYKDRKNFFFSAQNAKNETLLEVTSKYGYLNLVKFIIKKSKKQNFRKSFVAAIISGKSDIVSYLLRKGVDVNCKRKSFPYPVVLAIQNSRYEVVLLLLQNGGKIILDDELKKDDQKTSIGSFNIIDIKNFNELEDKSIKRLLPDICKRGDYQILKAIFDMRNFSAKTNISLSRELISKAALFGNAQTLEILFEKGFMIYNDNSIDKLFILECPNLLNSCLKQKDFKKIEILVEKGTNKDNIDLIFPNAIYFCLLNRSPYLAKYFFQNGASVSSNQVKKQFESIIKENSIKCVKTFLEILSKCMLNNRNNEEPEMFFRPDIIFKENSPLVTTILSLNEDNGISLNENKSSNQKNIICNNTPINYEPNNMRLHTDQPIKLNFEKIFFRFYSKPKVNSSILHNSRKVSQSSVFSMIKFLVKNGANVNGNLPFESTICSAMKMKSLSIIQLLIELGANANENVSDHSEIVSKELLLNSYDLIKSDLSLRKSRTRRIPIVFQAVHFEHEIIVRFMIEQCNCCITALSSNGQTILIDAIAHDAPINIISYLIHLIRTNTNFLSLLNHRDDNGETALFWASKLNNKEVINLLLPNIKIVRIGDEEEKENRNFESSGDDITIINDFETDLNIPRLDGTTPLMMASSLTNGLQIVRCLVLNGAAINWKSISGETALSCALTNFNEDIASFLVDHGADLFLSEKPSSFIFQFAKEMNDTRFKIAYNKSLISS